MPYLDPEVYATVADLRAEGLPTSISDDRTKYLLEKANEMIEKITRNFFRRVTGSFTFDGNNSTLLHLPNPVIEVTALKINDSTTSLDSSEYRVHNGTMRPVDDRRNPKITLRPQSRSIYSTGGGGKFYKGYDQVIEGTFGYLEPDGSVPATIIEAAIGITLSISQEMFASFYGRMGEVVGPVVRERTDDHELEWRSSVRDIPNYILPKFIEDRLMLFRGPIAVGAPNIRVWDGGN